MYYSFFEMKRRPFGATPHLATYYPASSQEEALATLRYAITQGRGIALLTGLPGMGKTLICHRLISGLDAAFTTAMITNTNMTSIKGLYQAILYDLSLAYHGLDEQELRLSLTDFLLSKYASGGRTVLIIDEAQNMPVPLLEELRMLGNIEGESDKVCQIVLSGHPRLIQVLRQTELETLNQRIGARSSLRALSDEETVGYIRHQLEYAGVLPDEVFTYDGMTAVYEASAGIPRLINQTCDHALLLAYVAETRRVDAGLVETASADLNRMINLELDSPSELASSSPQAVPTGSPSDRQPGLTVSDRMESAICATPPVMEDQDACLEIVDEEVASSGSSQELLTTNVERTVRKSKGRIEEEFAQEEIIVDPYAMMDAQRAAAMQLLQPSPQTKLVMHSDLCGEGSVVGRISEPFETPPVVSIRGENPTRSDVKPNPSGTHTQGRFVDAADNPAVHEVGAGIEQASTNLPNPPILVVDDRSHRLAVNLARVDSPQPKHSASGLRVYRRLFSVAKKN